MREGRLFFAGLVVALSAAAVNCGLKQEADGGGHSMRIPYAQDARICYDSLKNAPVLGPGLQRMIDAARGTESFETRLGTVQELRFRLVEEHRAMPTRRESMREEDYFVGAANDLLEAMFAAETEALAALPPSERPARAAFLLRVARSMELDPQWNDYTRARIVERIESAGSRPVGMPGGSAGG